MDTQFNYVNETSSITGAIARVTFISFAIQEGILRVYKKITLKENFAYLSNFQQNAQHP